MEASGHTAVLGGVDECSGAKDVVQQVASERISLFTLQVESQLQNLHQVRAVGQDLVAVDSRHLKETRPDGYRVKLLMGDGPEHRWSLGSEGLIGPQKVAGDSTTAPYRAPPRSALPRLLFKKIRVRQIMNIHGENHESCMWEPLLLGDYLLTAIWFMALQQCGTNILSDSAG